MTDFFLSYSSFIKYEECPQKFLFHKGWPQIDVGGGMGKPKPIPQRRCEYHAFLGTVIQNTLEVFYNDEWWRQPQDIVQRLEEATRQNFKGLLKKGRFYIEWDSYDKEESENQCVKAVTSYMTTLKKNGFLGHYAKSEVEIRVNLEGVKFWGIVDFIIDTKNHGLVILDGKNSKQKGKYTDPDQLRWYALLFEHTSGGLPQKIGFLYWRYPYGYVHENGDVDTGVTWVSMEREELDSLQERIKSAYKAIIQKKFEATPSDKSCFFCDYKTVCKERIDHVLSNRKHDPTVNPSIEEIGFE